jgi:hypothetical protein
VEDIIYECKHMGIIYGYIYIYHIYIYGGYNIWFYNIWLYNIVYGFCERKVGIRHTTWYFLSRLQFWENSHALNIEVSPQANNDQGLGEGLDFSYAICIQLLLNLGGSSRKTRGKAPKGNACETQLDQKQLGPM